MPKITWNATAKVGEEEIALTQEVEVDGYDVLEVLVKREKEVTVSLQPSKVKRLKVLAITADRYSSSLSYWWAGQGILDQAPPMTLDAPLLLTGGQIGLLSSAQQITFENQTKEHDVMVTIFIGRDAVVETVASKKEKVREAKSKEK